MAALVSARPTSPRISPRGLAILDRTAPSFQAFVYLAVLVLCVRRLIKQSRHGNPALRAPIGARHTPSRQARMPWPVERGAGTPYGDGAVRHCSATTGVAAPWLADPVSG